MIKWLNKNTFQEVSFLFISGVLSTQIIQNG